MKTINFENLDPTSCIPSHYVEALEASVAKLAKKAIKVGVEAPTLTIGETVLVVRNMGTVLGNVTFEYTEVKVTGPQPKINGYSFVAKVEHTEAGNMISMAPGMEAFELSESIRTIAPTCDHCGKFRQRNETFILVSESGDLIRVGRQCLRDFLGHTNPNQLVSLLMNGFGASDLVDIDEEFWNEGMGGGGQLMIHTSAFLAFVVSVARKEGWVSSKMVQDGVAFVTTGQTATNVFDKARRGQYKPDYNEIDLRPETEDWAIANKIIAWWESVKAEKMPLNNYFWNVGVAMNHTDSEGEFMIRAKDCNLVASIYGCWFRENAPKTTSKSEKFLGQVGDKLVVTGKVLSANWSESQWGVSTNLIVVTEDGTKAQWWQSGGHTYTPNEQITLTGKVKTTNEYKGEKYTVLTRCKVS